MNEENNTNNTLEKEDVANETANVVEESSNPAPCDCSDVSQTEEPHVETSDIQIIINPDETVNKEKKPINKKKLLIIAITAIAIILLIVICVVVSGIIKSNKQVSSVENSINNIGEVELTPECREKIDSAIASYNSLSEAQQGKVKNISSLLNADAAYDSLLYYDKLIDACNYTNKKATAAIEILNDMKTAWNNVIQRETDEYNNGDYDFDTALNAYWESTDYLGNSLLLFDEIDKDDNDKTINDYLSELKNPPEEYKEAYNAFTALYASYSSMVPLTKAINHTYSAFSSEVSSLSSDYKTQHGKAKALIPEID